MRRWILPADLARLRVERREPPLRLIRRIEYLGERGLVTEEKSSGRSTLDIPLDLDVRAPVHRCDEERICLRTERRAVPFDASLDAGAEAYHMVASRRLRLVRPKSFQEE